MGLPFSRNRFSDKTTEAVMIIWISTDATNDDYLYVDITFGYVFPANGFLQRALWAPARDLSCTEKARLASPEQHNLIKTRQGLETQLRVCSRLTLKKSQGFLQTAGNPAYRFGFSAKRAGQGRSETVEVNGDNT